jgi:Tetratricopeptide repeat
VGNLGAGLARVGRHDDALTASEEAVALWRDLDTTNSTVHRPNLATAVGNLGVGLARVGRHDDALTTHQEAVALWRGLAHGSPRYKSDLGTALDRLRTALRRQGREEEMVTEGLPVQGHPRRSPE